MLVPLKLPGGMFFGVGVRVEACARHAQILSNSYGGKLL